MGINTALSDGALRDSDQLSLDHAKLPDIPTKPHVSSTLSKLWHCISRSAYTRIAGLVLASGPGFSSSALAQTSNQPSNASPGINRSNFHQQIKSKEAIEADRSAWIIATAITMSDDPHLGHIMDSFNRRVTEYRRTNYEPIMVPSLFGPAMWHKALKDGVMEDIYHSLKVKYEKNTGQEFPAAFEPDEMANFAADIGADKLPPGYSEFIKGSVFVYDQLDETKTAVVELSNKAGLDYINQPVGDGAAIARRFYDLVTKDPVARELYHTYLRGRFDVNIDDSGDKMLEKMAAKKGMVAHLYDLDRQAAQLLMRQKGDDLRTTDGLKVTAEHVAAVHFFMRQIEERERALEDNRRYEGKWQVAHSGVVLVGNILAVSEVKDAAQISAALDRGYNVVKSFVDFGRELEKAQGLDSLEKIINGANPLQVMNSVFGFASLFFGGKSEIQMLQEWLQLQFDSLHKTLLEVYTRLDAKLDGLEMMAETMDRKLDAINFTLSRQGNQLGHIVVLLTSQHKDIQELLETMHAGEITNYNQHFATLRRNLFNTNGEYRYDPLAGIRQINNNIFQHGMSSTLNGNPEVRDVSAENYAVKQVFFQSTGNLLFMQRYYNDVVRKNKPDAPRLDLVKGPKIPVKGRTMIPESSGITYDYTVVDEKELQSLPNPVVLNDSIDAMLAFLGDNESGQRQNAPFLKTGVEGLLIARGQMNYLNSAVRNIHSDHIYQALAYSNRCIEGLLSTGRSTTPEKSSIGSFHNAFITDLIGTLNSPLEEAKDVGKGVNRIVTSNVDINLLSLDQDGLPTVVIKDGVVARTSYWVGAVPPKDAANNPDFGGRLVLRGDELGKYLPRKLQDLMILMNREDIDSPSLEICYNIVPTSQVISNNNFTGDLLNHPGHVEAQYEFKVYYLEFEVRLSPRHLPSVVTPVYRSGIPFVHKVTRRSHIHWGNVKHGPNIYVSPPEDFTLRTDNKLSQIFVDSIWESDNYLFGGNEGKKGNEANDSVPNSVLGQRTSMADGIKYLEGQPTPGMTSFGFRTLGGAEHLKPYAGHVNLRAQMVGNTAKLEPRLTPEEQQLADSVIDLCLNAERAKLRDKFRVGVAKSIERKDDGTLGASLWSSYQSARSSVSFVRHLFWQIFPKEMAFNPTTNSQEPEVYQLFHGGLKVDVKTHGGHSAASIDSLGESLPSELDLNEWNLRQHLSIPRRIKKSNDGRVTIEVTLPEDLPLSHTAYAKVLDFLRESGDSRFTLSPNEASASDGEALVPFNITARDYFNYFNNHGRRNIIAALQQGKFQGHPLVTDAKDKLIVALDQVATSFETWVANLEEWDKITSEMKADYKGHPDITFMRNLERLDACIASQHELIRQVAGVASEKLDKAIQEAFEDGETDARVELKKLVFDEFWAVVNEFRMLFHDPRRFPFKLPSKIAFLDESELAILIKELRFDKLEDRLEGHRVACKLLKHLAIDAFQRGPSGEEISRGNQAYQAVIDSLDAAIAKYGQMAVDASKPATAMPRQQP